MRSVFLWFLVIANVLLLANLIGRFTQGDIATAQVQPQRRVSDYLLTPVELANGQTGVVCIIDENAGQMAAVAYDGRNSLDVMPPINLETPPPRRNNLNGGRGY
jgi:hypothetical protein